MAYRRLRPGQLLKGGAYQIQGPLSKGGMGAVYLAKDIQAFGRPCVIKEMLDYYDRSDPAARARAEARFAEEGRTLAWLSHPGIPKIYAFFEEDGRHFIVMEYILGENLEQYVTRVDDTGQVIPRRAMPEEEVLRCAVQVCNILEYLAEQPTPVIHQDIKPANLIRESVLGDVRLVDFGTAGTGPHAIWPGSQAAPSIYGTVGYAAPEQCQGKPTPKSDVYSLAATIYHLLTDDDPRQHPGDFPKLADLRPELRTALERALRANPLDRCTATQLREQLEAILTPRRTVRTFAFPGGDRITGVSALPVLCDKHWRAARRYLYGGDLERWLRDLNRLDLVELAKEMRRRYRDQNAGLEAFLRRLDPGLPRPRLSVRPRALDLGRVARMGQIAAKLELRNASRGYATVRLKPSVPWIQVQPSQVGLLAKEPPVTVVVAICTSNLALRSRHRGEITINAGIGGRTVIPVSLEVSVLQEIGRLLARLWQGALPSARAAVRRMGHSLGQRARRIGGALWAHPRWLLGGYLTLAVLGCGALWRLGLTKEGAVYGAVALLTPPLVVALLGTFSALALLAGAATIGAIKGALHTRLRK